MTAAAPRVSVVVCTRDRPDELARALRSVQAQDYRDYELIVVDDGTEVAAEAPAGARRIATGGRGPGAARAAGLDAARGAYVAWCDDDDEWLPGHLATLVARLDAEPRTDLVYADSEWERGDVPYSIDYDALILREANHVFPTDVLLRADAARAAGGFDTALQACEDWDLWLRMSRTTLLRHVPQVLARRHHGPGSVLMGGRWQERHEVYERHQAWLRDAGPVADHDLRPGAAPRRRFDPATWSGARRELIWHSILRPHQSFGSVARRLLPALVRQGVDVTIAPTGTQPSRELERFHRDLDHWGRFGFYYDYRQRPSVLPAARIVNYAMWETSAVPERIVEDINATVELQYVPSEWTRRNFIAAGVEVPIRVLHHGVDAAEFPLAERPSRSTFTFGTMGELSPRKGIDVIVRAFASEFGPRERVRLLLRSSRPVDTLGVDDPRIELRTGFVSQAALQQTLGEMDAFVLASRGEGFGLCGLEAMSTGLPLIATDSSGPTEYLDDADCLRLRWREAEAGGVRSNETIYHGTWAEPDVEHLRELMRSLYEEPDRARELGARAAERVRREWSWDRPARQIRDDLDELA